MSSAASTAPKVLNARPEELLSELSLINEKAAKTKFIDKHPDLLNTDAVLRLAEMVRSQAKSDTSPAISLAESAVLIAQRLRDRSALAHSFRAMGNALYLNGQYKAAIRFHGKASGIFSRLSNAAEVARTLNASIQPLILTGQYDRAFAAAKKAREIFSRDGDRWRVARVELNAGNIFHRQDRFSEALEYYERARRQFALNPEKDPEAQAVSLHNVAMCLVGLNDFPRALAAHQEARQFALEHGMQVLVGQSDYNIASLYYFRGEYTRAIDRLLSTRDSCHRTNDHYHVALCNLDLSEIYLELNQSTRAEEMAQQAAESFERLEMGYEAAKALANVALAMWQQGRAKPALDLFTKARTIFVKESNSVWPSRIDLYRAIILMSQNETAKALRLSHAALDVFRTSRIPLTTILSRLLLAHLYLSKGNNALARRYCSTAERQAQALGLPVLLCQANHVMGRIHAAQGHRQEAFNCYEQARELLEVLRGGVSREELRISFMRNHLEIYEGLVELCLDGNPARKLREAFGYVEQSKSRSLRDLIYKSGSEFQITDDLDQKLARKIRDLRAEINWYSRRSEADLFRKGGAGSKALSEIKAHRKQLESELLRLVRDMPYPVAESAGLVSQRAASVEEVRSALPSDATLLEYFKIRDQFVAIVLTHDSLEIVPLSSVSHVNDLIGRLQFQFSKFRLGAAYAEQFSKSLMQAALEHLSDLHDALIRPIGSHLQGSHLVIVPHGELHSLPFQALFDGQQYLLDTFSLTCSPSATIFSLCHDRPDRRGGSTLILGVPDAEAPFVRDEINAIATTIPASELFIGDSATASVLRTKGQHSRVIHIATHGYFRQDNPMFSGIRLGDGILSLYDLYQMKLPAELITLSGCATGLSVLADGDELLGLLRGLIHAGAKSVLLSLWDVNDRTTAEFMSSFYMHLSRGVQRTAALREASLELRNTHPHPYYWAPFVLVGG